MDSNRIGDISNVTKRAIQHLDETETDAMVMITVNAPAAYWKTPSLTVPSGFGESIAAVIQSGRKVLLNLFPNMNSKPTSSQKTPTEPVEANQSGVIIPPSDFLASYRRFRNVTLDAIPQSNRPFISFIWSPSCFVDRAGVDAVSSSQISRFAFSTLDITGDGIIDKYDDPYLPYYPGDLNLNYVGCEIVPKEPSLDSMTIQETLGTGFNGWSLYRSFSSQNRPFIITSLGIPYVFSTTSQSQFQPIQSRQTLKQWLYSQIDGPLLLSSFPKLRIINFAEYSQILGTTATDYGNTGCSPNLATICKESEADATVEDFLDMMGSDGFGYANDITGKRSFSGPARKTNSSLSPSKNSNWVLIGSITGTAAALILAAGVILMHRWSKTRAVNSSSKSTSKEVELELSTREPSTDSGDTTMPSPFNVFFSSTSIIISSSPPSSPTISPATTKAPTPIRPPTPDKLSSTLFTQVHPSATSIHSSTSDKLSSTLVTQIDPDSTLDPPEKQSTLFPSLPSTSIILLETSDNTSNQKEKSPTPHRNSPTPEPLTWSTTRVKGFLLESGVSPYLADILEANGITGYKLLLLSHPSLQEMGVELLAARNLILFVASQLRDGGSSSGSAEDGAGGSVAAAGEGDAPPEYTH
ncbi:hypothetical protein HDU97_007449 [Phlyctochytrium planicorne]|nr:hypothetical protein HDU97_007449 [Phlyctochytrium planicorne]